MLFFLNAFRPRSRTLETAFSSWYCVIIVAKCSENFSDLKWWFNVFFFFLFFFLTYMTFHLIFIKYPTTNIVRRVWLQTCTFTLRLALSDTCASASDVTCSLFYFVLFIDLFGLNLSTFYNSSQLVKTRKNKLKYYVTCDRYLHFLPPAIGSGCRLALSDTCSSTSDVTWSIFNFVLFVDYF